MKPLERIAHTESSHGWGGQEIRILTESSEFIRRGFKVTLITDPQSCIFNRADRYGVPTVAARLRRKNILDLLSTRRAIKKVSPQIIVCHSSTDHWIAALARLTLLKKPAIIRIRHVSAAVSRNSATRWLYNHGAEKVITTSSQITNELIKDKFISPDRVVTIPTGIDISKFSPTGKDVARKALSIPQDAFIFGNISTLRSWKGHHDLLTAFSKTRNKLPPDSRLLLVGDGPQRESLTKLARELSLIDQIVFAGHQQEIQTHLSAMDGFIFPSYASEGVPQAVLQAMAAGLPIAVSNHPGVLEASLGYTSRYIFDRRDIEGIGQGLIWLCENKDVRNPPSPEIANKISLDNMFEKMLNVFYEVI